MFVLAVREVLQHFLILGVWDRAQNHVFGSSLGLRPDLRPGKSRIRQAKKQQKWQELYFLEAILQGSTDLHAEASLLTTKVLSGVNGVVLQCMSRLGHIYPGSASIFFGVQKQRPN